MTFEAILGWIPAIVFPIATALQLLAIVRRRDSAGVSVIGWLLFAVANVSLYFYMDKRGELQAILSGLGTATLNIAVMFAALAYRRPKRD